MTYLAIPYSWNPDKAFEIANVKAAELMLPNRDSIFSPISHSHPIARHMPESYRLDQEFWMDQDLPMLRLCKKVVVIVPCMDGDTSKGLELVANSKGCNREVQEANKCNIMVEYHKVNIH
jgi:hypothetical protein